MKVHLPAFLRDEIIIRAIRFRMERSEYIKGVPLADLEKEPEARS
jgi:hypothetical protein